MAQPLVDIVLVNARAIVANRRLRLLGAEAALIRAAYTLTGDQEQAHRVGWHVAGLIAKASNLRQVDEDQPGWSLAMLSDRRGQAAVLRAIDALIEQRRN